MARTEDIEEHRLAVVMNGGVSLAVWMGGFARQLDDVRRASLGRPAPPGDGDNGARAERRLHELWRGHTASTRVIVDVVAGTSAGGLNGVLLAMAIAGDTPLTILRALWMRAAQLDEQGLLRPQEQAASVLSGGYFLEQIRGALRELSRTDGGTGDDVVLTVTATALKGGPRTVRDACGAVFTQPDHRRRFTFARTGRHVTYAAPTDGGDGFTTAAVDDLTDLETVALTARASASFPAAFEPVRESSGMHDRRRWPTWATGGPEWLADGGILDNSPFEPVLRSISERPVESTWRRTLCYVVPSADESDPSRSIPAPAPAPGGEGEGPQPPWTSVLAAAVGLPREADLRDDVEQIHDVLRAGRSSYDVRRLDLLLADRTLLTRAVALATAGFGLYREARAAAGIYQIRDATLPPELFVRSPGEVVPDDVLKRRDLRWLPAEFPTTLPTDWTWGLAAAQRVVAVLLRSLAHDSAVRDELRAGLSTVKLQVAAVDRAVHDELSTRELPDDDPVATAELADRVFDDLRVPATLGRLVVDAVRQYAALKLDEEDRALEVLQAALCTEVVNGAGGVPVETKARPLFDFRRMGVSEPPRLFAEAVAEARRTAPAGGNGASDLLYGTRLGHFAAFGRPAWREWDWLWGRISATVHLGRLLDLDDDAVDALVREVVAAEGTTVEDVREGIAQVFAVDDRQLLDDLRADGLLPPALDSVFALLASARETAPPLPRLVARAGATASLLAARHHPPGGSTLQRVGRGSTLVVRRWWWRRLAP